MSKKTRKKRKRKLQQNSNSSTVIKSISAGGGRTGMIRAINGEFVAYFVSRSGEKLTNEKRFLSCDDAERYLMRERRVHSGKQSLAKPENLCVVRDGDRKIGRIRKIDGVKVKYLAYPNVHFTKRPGKFETYQEAVDYLHLMHHVKIPYEPRRPRVRRVNFGKNWNSQGIGGWNGG